MSGIKKGGMNELDDWWQPTTNDNSSFFFPQNIFNSTVHHLKSPMDLSAISWGAKWK
jgi:hypothetical protein